MAAASLLAAVFYSALHEFSGSLMIMSLIKEAKSPFLRGHACLEVEMVAGQSAVTSTYATSPLKILTPRSRGASVWAFTSSFGGGLVAGDQTRIDIKVGPAARCFVGTQASTKVYRNPSRLPCSHVTCATLASGATLIFAPDPVQAFAESTYVQRQDFHLAEDSGLILVDWFTSGRAARGERWNFSNLQSRNDIFIAGQRVFVDSIRLNPASGFIASLHQTGRFNCFAMLLLLGQPWEKLARQLLQEISSQPVAVRAALVASASPIPGGALLRAAGESVEKVGFELHRHLGSTASLMGGDPWLRKW
jgi:urease accessory protein